MRRFLFAITILIFCVNLFAQDTEEITIITYYPSPYGEYTGIIARSLAIGKDCKIPVDPVLFNIDVAESGGTALFQVGGKAELSSDKIFPSVYTYDSSDSNAAYGIYNEVIAYGNNDTYGIFSKAKNTSTTGDKLSYGIYSDVESNATSIGTFYGLFGKSSYDGTTYTNTEKMSFCAIKGEGPSIGIELESDKTGLDVEAKLDKNIDTVTKTSYGIIGKSYAKTGSAYGIYSSAYNKDGTGNVYGVYAETDKASADTKVYGAFAKGKKYGIYAKSLAGSDAVSILSHGKDYGIYIDNSEYCGVYAEGATALRGCSTGMAGINGTGVKSYGEKYGVYASASVGSGVTGAKAYGIRSEGNPAVIAEAPDEDGKYAGYFSGKVMVVSGVYEEPTSKSYMYDIAEAVPCSPDVDDGDVVIINPEENYLFKKSHKPCDSRVAGVISENPTFCFGDIEELKKENSEINYKYLALAGKAYVKVDSGDEGIKIGDLLTTGSIPGYAMKSKKFIPGTILGKALEPLEKGRKKIRVLICLF